MITDSIGASDRQEPWDGPAKVARPEGAELVLAGGEERAPRMLDEVRFQRRPRRGNERRGRR